MAVNPNRPLTRKELGEFLVDANGRPNMRAIIAFEQTQTDANAGAATSDTSLLTVLDEEPLLANSRRMVFVDPLVATDTGPGGVLSVNLRDTTVVDGPYGSASKTVSFVVSRRGRILEAAEYDLDTSNITEGTNLFYTDGRSRLAISGSVGNIAYDNTTGVINLATTAVTPGTYGDATNVAQVTFDAYGRATAATDVPINMGGFSGTVAPPLSLTFVNGICTAAT